MSFDKKCQYCGAFVSVANNSLYCKDNLYCCRDCYEKEDEPVNDDIKPKNEMIDKITTVCDSIEKTLISKNTDYGNSFQETLCKYGDVAFMVRLDDKFARLNSLFKNQSVWVKDESFEDTVRDIAGYCLLFLAIKKEEEK